MQGVLAQAKNGDQVFWQEKFYAANGKAQACTQGALIFSPFMFCGGAGGEGEFFFHFSQLPNVFALCSLQVPNGFPISQCFPLSPYHLTFIPYALENGVLLSPI
jgi:hypothetical protein